MLDALGSTWRTVTVRPDPGRVPVTALADYDAFCGLPPARVEGSYELEPKLLADLLAARTGQGDLLLVDVREPDEHALVAIRGA